MLNSCKLILIDEVNVKFEGLSATMRQKLMSAVKEMDHTAKYTPAGRLGRWDGTVHFMQMGGATYFHMLPILLPILEENHWHVDIEDNRKHSTQFEFDIVDENVLSDSVFPEGHFCEGQPITLRPHQVKIVNALLSNRHGVAVAATGAGKSLVCAALAKKVEVYGRTIVIVPNMDLVLQTEEDYKLVGLDCGVLFGERKDYGKTHTICTWQSLHSLWKKSKKKARGEIEMTEEDIYEFLDGVVNVIVDETHTAKGDALKSVLGGVMGDIPLRWGLTGTLPKDKIHRKQILTNVGEQVVEINATELQELGVLSRCHVHITQLASKLGFDAYQDELKWLTTDPTRLTYIGAMISAMALGGNCLVLVDRIEAGTTLRDVLIDMGIDVVFVNGSTNKDKRKQSYGLAAKNDGQVIIATYGVAAVGLNIPRIFNLVLLEPGKSFIRTIQSIGRGLRRAHDKDFVQIYDMCSSTKFSKKHLTERKKFYKEANYDFEIHKIKESDWKNI